MGWQLFASSAEHDVFMFQNQQRGLQVSVYRHADGSYELGQIWGA